MSGPPLTPPEPSFYCPVCYGLMDDAFREEVGGWVLLTCPGCGSEVNEEQVLTKSEMRAEVRDDAADDANEERWLREDYR